MRIFKAILVASILFITVSALVSYFLKASFVLTPILVAGILVFFTFVHLPEDMPGGYDNPEGEGIHPYRFFFIAAGITLVSILVWYIFPALANYGLYNAFQ